MTATTSARLPFPPAADSVPAARHFVVERLHEHGCRAITLEAELAVTELAANAVKHAGTGFIVGVSKEDQTLLIEVSDENEALPRLREPDDRGGRGLHMVDSIALEWGTRPAGPGAPGKTVFVRFAC